MHSILFLDIDGVLNLCGSARQRGGREVFCSSAVVALREILNATDANIVISSSWREDAAERIPIAFQNNGLGEVVHRIVGFTPIIPDAPEQTRRADEIDAWWAENGQPGSSFVVLDDDPAAALTGHFICVNPDLGLTLQNARQAIEMFRSPKP